MLKQETRSLEFNLFWHPFTFRPGHKSPFSSGPLSFDKQKYGVYWPEKSGHGHPKSVAKYIHPLPSQISTCINSFYCA